MHAPNFRIPPHSSLSFWNHDSEVQEFYRRPAATLPESAAVVIVGAGIAGVSTAYWLSRRGVKDILIVDGRGLAGGATGRNGGHCWPQIRTTTGDPEARKAVDFEHQNFALVENFLKENDLEKFVEWNNTGGLLLGETKEERCSFLKMEEENQSCKFWDQEKLHAQLNISRRFTCALFTPVAAQLRPSRLLLALFGKSGDAVKLHSLTTVIGVDRGEAQTWRVMTDRGNVTAGRVVFAINAYTPTLLPEFSGVIRPVRGQMCVTQPLQEIICPYSLSIHDGDDYFIQRRSDRRIAFGGFRRFAADGKREENTYDDNVVDRSVAKAIHGALKEIFNVHMEDDSREWTGIMGFTPDERPLVGSLENGRFIAAGFTGHGMAYSLLAARHLAVLVDDAASEAERSASRASLSPFRVDRFDATMKSSGLGSLERAKL